MPRRRPAISLSTWVIAYDRNPFRGSLSEKQQLEPYVTEKRFHGPKETDFRTYKHRSGSKRSTVGQCFLLSIHFAFGLILYLPPDILHGTPHLLLRSEALVSVVFPDIKHRHGQIF